jgi:hypothetical protein
MQTTYAVTWQEADDAVHEGRLELQEAALRLESAEAVCELQYRDVTAVRLGPEAIGRRQALVVERRVGPPLRIASAAQEAMVSELAHRLAALVLPGRKTSRVVVVLPIKAAAREAVRELLAKGPPFDPEASGLDGHHVFLTETEVVFIFEASHPSVLRQLVANLELLAAAEAWWEHAAGTARIAEQAFSWTRPDFAEGLSFAATPGPGDSEGGDLYPP